MAKEGNEMTVTPEISTAEVKTKKIRRAKAPAAAPRERKARIPVSELHLRKAASRLLTTKLVSTEIVYLQRVLGSYTTQEELDAKVIAVRGLPWASIVVPD